MTSQNLLSAVASILFTISSLNLPSRTSFTFFPLPQCYCCVCVEMNRQHNTGIHGNRSPTSVQSRSKRDLLLRIHKCLSRFQGLVSYLFLGLGGSDGCEWFTRAEEGSEATVDWSKRRRSVRAREREVRDGTGAEAAKEQAPRLLGRRGKGRESGEVQRRGRGERHERRPGETRNVNGKRAPLFSS